MNKSGRVLTVLLVLLALFSTIGCSKLRARDQLNKGVQSYKNAKYEEAIEHFNKRWNWIPAWLRPVFI